MAENTPKQNALNAGQSAQAQKPAAQPMKNNDISPDAGPRKPRKDAPPKPRRV